MRNSYLKIYLANLSHVTLIGILSVSLSAQAEQVGMQPDPLDVFSANLPMQTSEHFPEYSDDMDELLADRGLLAQLEQVRQTLTSQASELVVTAMGFVGVPYRLGGDSASSGFDCSGFVRSIYEQTVGLVLPRVAAEQAAATQAIPKNDLQPGDLVFFNTLRRAFSHVGIYVGNGKFIHSPRSGSQVRIESMQNNYWQTRFNGARRVHLPKEK